MKHFWLVCIVLAGCGPVLVGKERADAEEDAGSDAGDGALAVRLRVRPEGCRCFQLTAEATGGQAPYRFVWDDGTEGASREVCGEDGSELSVVAEDIAGGRGEQSAVLEAYDAGCPPEPMPLLCLRNPSFEGTAAVNTGLPPAFDAPPWSACTATGVSNTPDIVSPSLPQIVVKPVPPTDGLTYLALGEDEQTSQQLCEPVQAGRELALQLDLIHIPVSADTEQIWLELWGGPASECSTGELLWTSPALELGWKTYCASLRPRNYTDQLTLRAVSDKSQLGLSYLLVDHLVPVERCP